jgi:hypothetical protein
LLCNGRPQDSAIVKGLNLNEAEPQTERMCDMSEEKQWAPYAPSATVLHVIGHYRQRDVPPKIALNDLIQIGVPASLAPRTLPTLEFLGLVNEKGQTTEAFKALRFANNDEFPGVLAGILQAAYKDIFDHVDPGTATLAAVTNAFFPYSPGGQRDRMVSLFLGLVAAAGLPVKALPKQMPRRPSVAKAPKISNNRLATVPRTVRLTVPSLGGGAAETAGDLVIGVTDEDLLALPADSFDRVWAVLGEIRLARARARAAASTPPVTPETEQGEETEGEV